MIQHKETVVAGASAVRFFSTPHILAILCPAQFPGVYLHVLADTLGSVGVIISSLLIEYAGLNIADPICSLCIAVLIFVSVLPLLRQSVEGLLLITPPEVRRKVNECLRHLPENVTGVERVARVTVWLHTADKIMANVAVVAGEGVDCREVAEQVIVTLVFVLKCAKRPKNIYQSSERKSRCFRLLRTLLNLSWKLRCSSNLLQI